MARFAQRSAVRVVAAAKVAEAKVKRVHARQLLHAGITALLLLLYLWPGAMLVNTVEPRVLGIPFYVFWVVFLLPALNVVNLIVYARFMAERERTLKAANLEPWE